MRALGAVVLRDRVDAVALLQMLRLHLHHVVLDDLRHVARSGGQRRRGGRGEGEPDGGGQGGSSTGAKIHGLTFQGDRLDASRPVTSPPWPRRLQCASKSPRRRTAGAACTVGGAPAADAAKQRAS